MRFAILQSNLLQPIPPGTAVIDQHGTTMPYDALKQKSLQELEGMGIYPMVLIIGPPGIQERLMIDPVNPGIVTHVKPQFASPADASVARQRIEAAYQAALAEIDAETPLQQTASTPQPAPPPTTDPPAAPTEGSATSASSPPSSGISGADAGPADLAIIGTLGQPADPATAGDKPQGHAKRSASPKVRDSLVKARAAAAEKRRLRKELPLTATG